MSSSIYGKHAASYARTISDNAYNAHHERPMMLSLLPDVKGKRVLDLGCGPGLHAAALVGQGAFVRAVDASPEMIGIVQATHGGAIDAYVQDISQGLPREEDASFDVVMSSLTVHYIEDLRPLFGEVHRVLKKNGLFVFSTHHPLNDFELSPSGVYFEREAIVEDWDTIGQPVEVRFYRRPLTEFFRTLRDAGFVTRDFVEGRADEALRDHDTAAFARLSKEPAFMFFTCVKRGPTMVARAR